MSDLAARLAALSPEKRALLERRLHAEKAIFAPGRIPKREGTAPPPLSFAQQRLWFFEQLEPGLAFYNLAASTPLEGAVSAEVLQRALDELVRRHESLRTRFAVEGVEPVQVIAPELHVRLEQTDLGDRPAEQRAQEAARIIEEEAMQPFELGRGPLLRARLLRLADGEHFLALALHHIIADGWSLDVLFRELNALYPAFAAGQPSPLPELPIQYADFAIWQRRQLSGATLAALLDHWKTKLAGMPALLELPTDRPRPRLQSFHGGSYVTPYARAPIEALRAVAREQDATLFMALLAAFEVLLHRFSGVEDMVVGTPVANRNRIEIEGLIGFFVNALVLRTSLSGRPSFRQVLARVKETTLDAFAHQDLPFERLVEELSPSRKLGHNPLFQVMFGMQNIGRERAAHNAPARFAAGTSKFDLSASAAETDEGVSGVFEFNTELFGKETVASLAETYGRLIEAAAAAPDAPISTLPLLSRERRAELIREAATPGVIPEELRVHGLFEEQAMRTPDAIAAEYAGERLSYRELDVRASRLAGALSERGVRPGSLIGLSVDRGLELIVGLLGTLKAGAAFVPLDPAYPSERLAYMIADARVSIVLDAGAVSSLAAELPPRAPVSPDALAYVIYTSGSTGRPKGVMVTHRSAANVAQAQREVFALQPGTRVLQFASLSFDAFVFEALLAFGCGGTLVLAPKDAILPGPPLAELLAAERIQALTIPPSSLAVLPKIELPELHTLIAAGESLPPELAARWSTGRRMYNAYGPTEATIWSTVSRCAETSSIGRAIANTQAYVLDDRLEPVPPGFPGELYLGGAGIACGYLNRPALTAERYLPDPFSAVPGARLYRTGDRAKRTANGELSFLGRADGQLKLRGYRIELGEIEATLLACAGVHEAAVVAQRTPGGETRLIAYCVPKEGASLDRRELLQILKSTLPEFMVPADVRISTALPLTGSGKLDRARLAEHAADEAPLESMAEGPSSSVEERLISVFRAVLEVDEVRAADSFFELGGHSLLATRAVARINETFGIALPLRAIFEAPTVAELAHAVEQEREHEREEEPR